MENWLNKYQKGGKVTYGTPEYTDAYNKGEVITKEGIHSPILLDEVTVRGKKKSKNWLEQYADKIVEENKDAGPLGAIIGTPLSAITSLPQMLATKLMSGKMQRPSEAMDIQNPVGAFTMDAIADPVNLIGAGLLTKEKLLSGITRSTENGLLSNTYKLSPKTLNFKSEINWGKWNKEIPENSQLMKEYNAIEQTSKANNTWMKNPDGSAFQGTPEQFVQQNSENFKKAFPNGFEETYRGTTGESPNLKPNRAMFTAESKVARAYAGRDNVDNILKSEEIVNEGGVHHFVYPKSENSLVHNTGGSHWTDVNLNSSETNIKNIDLNIQRLTEDIARKQKMMQEAFQNSDGSWSFPNSDLKLSNQLYKEGTSESERMLTKLKSQKNLIQKGEYTSNPALLNKMKSDFGTDKVITDDIAEYIEKNNIDNVTLRNVEDGIFGDISIINHKPGNYLKSYWGNNGMFDMTNPNIYKSVLPIGLGLGAASQIEKNKNGGWLSKYN